MAFGTCYWLFEFLVMHFEFTKPPASFEEFILDTLRTFMDIFSTAFFDGILIHSDYLAEHKEHIRAVILTLKYAGVYLKVENCECHKQEVKYLGLIVEVNRVRMDLENVQTVEDWEALENLKEVQVFLGFDNFYQQFIRNFNKVV
jgi:hypothetical protein